MDKSDKAEMVSEKVFYQMKGSKVSSSFLKRCCNINVATNMIFLVMLDALFVKDLRDQFHSLC